jgi:hypothetical protein
MSGTALNLEALAKEENREGGFFSFLPIEFLNLSKYIASNVSTVSRKTNGMYCERKQSCCNRCDLLKFALIDCG